MKWWIVGEVVLGGPPCGSRRDSRPGPDAQRPGRSGVTCGRHRRFMLGSMPLIDVRAGPTYAQASTLTFDDIPEKRRVMSHRSPAADQRCCVAVVAL